MVVSIKAGEGGRTFGSVSSKEIATAYKEQCGKEIDKKKIILPEPIKSFGVYEVAVKLHPKVTGNPEGQGTGSINERLCCCLPGSEQQQI